MNDFVKNRARSAILTETISQKTHRRGQTRTSGQRYKLASNETISPSPLAQKQLPLQLISFTSIQIATAELKRKLSQKYDQPVDTVLQGMAQMKF